MRALVAYSASSTFVQTTLDYLNAFKKYSGFETNYVHVTHDARIDFNFDAYDLVFHNYCARLCFDGYVSADYRERMRKFRGVKILAVQDEYDHTDKLKAAIRDLGFDIVLTCVPQESLDYVYPRAEFPGVTFLTVFTGYVSDDFASNHPVPMPLAERPITIGYRGRDIGGKYGRLGFDKFEIGRRMKEICVERSIAHDIAMDEQSRIYGMAWFEFLGSCRAMLGTESGSNVFDFDSSLDAKFKEMTAANGGVPPSYAQFLPMVAQRDSEISMGQISPRVFECALMRTPMLLFRGHYSGAIQPDEHYIALEKDFSNIDEVLARLEDLPALKAMTERAYDHLVGSGRFSYRAFFGMVGKDARRHGAGRAPSVPPEFVASEAAFFLQNGQAFELPATLPDTAEAMRLRVGLATSSSLLPEIVRLEKEFLLHAAACTGWLCTLDAGNRQAFQAMTRRFGGEAGIMLPPPPIMSSQVTDFVAAAKAQDASWFVHQRATASGVDAISNGAPVSRSDYALLLTDQAGVQDRYRCLSDRFERFSAVYEPERVTLASYSASLDSARLQILQMAWARIRQGREIKSMTAIIAREGARTAARRLWLLVRPVAAPLVDRARRWRAGTSDRAG
jgi:hypothetical protein